MAFIFQSRSFAVEAPDQPLIDRADGGHITINPITPISDRQQLTPAAAIELMRLTIVTGQAMQTIMKNHGVNIGRINYQDNGNWSVFKPEGPVMHIHIYGRAINAITQPYGQTLYFPHRDVHPEFYQAFKPLMKIECVEIGMEIGRHLQEEKYWDSSWGIGDN
jgi:diadenosine tetraphosphate (Ap4A) HIT family hydrolase